jgi:non-specific serine/threonine protein kinase
MTTSYLERVIAARDELGGPSPEAWYDRLEREESELEAALEVACQSDPRIGLDAAPLLQRFWFARGRLDRGRRWVERLLNAADEEPTPERAQGLAAAAGLAFRQGDNDVTKQRAQQALDVARAVDRQDVEVEALLALARAGLRDEDPNAVRLHALEARKIALDLTDEDRELSAIHHLAEGARMAGDLDEARTLYAESLDRNRARGAQLIVAVELTNFGYVEKASGRLDVAEARVREAIPISLSIDNSYLLAHNLVALAAIVAAGGRSSESARLLGKADAIFAETGLVLDPADKPEYDGAVTAAAAKCSEYSPRIPRYSPQGPSRST